MLHIMYRYNKANLWLRIICVTVALLGMLFFTHSQFSIAVAPTSIGVTISTTDATPLAKDDTFTIEAVIMLGGSETIMGNVDVTYTIGSIEATDTLSTTDTSSPYTYSKTITIVDDNGDLEFTKINFATDVEPQKIIQLNRLACHR